MLRLIGLVVVVLLVLSLAHGERSGSYAEANARADTLVDGLTARLADGLRALGDGLFGPGPYARRSVPRDLTADFDDAVQSADTRSRRALAGMVLRACPELGLSCQPAAGRSADRDDGVARGQKPAWNDPR